jgi:capsular polysaccharide transport system ATP-binding protein
MIELRNLSKTYRVRGEEKVVLDRVNATFESGARVGLLGVNGAGKSTLLSIIAGTVDPDWGEVVTDGTISWPVGFRGSFHRDLTGAQNTRFVARIYGVDSEELSDFVEDFAELGRHYHQPFRTYSSGMRSRLSFGVSMGIPFDTYLVDEATSVGDAVFKSKSSLVFLDRLRVAGAIFVSHSMKKVRQFCTMGAVISEGQLHVYDDIEDAIAHHEAIVEATLGFRGEDEEAEDD